MNTPIAIGVAIIKASLVATFFMGLRWDKGFNAILFVGAICCMLLFFLFTFADVAFRGDITPEEAGFHDLKTPVKLIKPGEHSEPGHH